MHLGSLTCLVNLSYGVLTSLSRATSNDSGPRLSWCGFYRTDVNEEASPGLNYNVKAGTLKPC